MFTKHSNNKWYLTISAIVFTVVAVGHFGIILFQMPATVGEYLVPYELNGLVVIVLGYLATRGFMAAGKL